MKKKCLIALLFVFSLVFMTGCGGGKKLVCKMEQEKAYGSYLFKINSIIELEYDKDEIITSADAEIEMTVPNDAYKELENAGIADSTMKQIASQLENSFGDNSSLLESKTNINKNKVDVYLKIDASKKQRTKQEAIEYYESGGYKCS